jgi:hypothetical protein
MIELTGLQAAVLCVGVKVGVSVTPVGVKIGVLVTPVGVKVGYW